MCSVQFPQYYNITEDRLNTRRLIESLLKPRIKTVPLRYSRASLPGCIAEQQNAWYWAGSHIRFLFPRATQSFATEIWGLASLEIWATTVETESELPSRVCSSLPVRISQSLIMWSYEPDATVWPSGEKATDETGPKWPSRVYSFLPVWVSRAWSSNHLSQRPPFGCLGRRPQTGHGRNGPQGFVNLHSWTSLMLVILLSVSEFLRRNILRRILPSGANSSNTGYVPILESESSCIL